MTRYIVRRLLALGPLLLLVSIVVFALELVSPWRVRRRLPVADESLVDRYLSWLEHAVHFDFGTSSSGSTRVTTSIASHLPPTVSLMGLALILSVAIGISIGIVAASMAGTWVDRLVSITTAGGLAIPSFWLGSMLIVVLALNNHVFPAAGYVSPAEGTLGWLRSLALPAITLAAGPAAVLAREARGALLDVLDRDYIRTARAIGVPPSTIMLKHALKNAAGPVLTTLSQQVTLLLGGALFVEQVFGINGMGQFTLARVLANDVPTVQAIILLNTAVVVLVNLGADVAYACLNPRVRP